MNASVHHILKHFCCLCTKSYATCQRLFITLHNFVSLLWNQHVHMGFLSLSESTWPLTYRVFLQLNMMKVSIIKTVGWLCIAYLIFEPVNPWICVLCFVYAGVLLNSRVMRMALSPWGRTVKRWTQRSASVRCTANPSGWPLNRS